MNAIQELKDEIYNLGPSWNLFGKVDRMKYLIDQIEQGSINANVVRPESASASDGELLATEAGAQGVSDGCKHLNTEKLWDDVYQCKICDKLIYP